MEKIRVCGQRALTCTAKVRTACRPARDVHTAQRDSKWHTHGAIVALQRSGDVRSFRYLSVVQAGSNRGFPRVRRAASAQLLEGGGAGVSKAGFPLSGRCCCVLRWMSGIMQGGAHGFDGVQRIARMWPRGGLVCSGHFPSVLFAAALMAEQQKRSSDNPVPRVRKAGA